MFSPHPGDFPSDGEVKIFKEEGAEVLVLGRQGGVAAPPTAQLAAISNLTVSKDSTCGIQ